MNNWSPQLIKDENKTCLGMEYVCNENDKFWKGEDASIIKLGLKDLNKLGLFKEVKFMDGFISRIPKTYPVYDETYPENIKIVREYLDKFENLQPIGRYGMFKYNNMDHSILTGLFAAENILGKKHNIWEINADDDYQEEK